MLASSVLLQVILQNPDNFSNCERNKVFNQGGNESGKEEDYPLQELLKKCPSTVQQLPTGKAYEPVILKNDLTLTELEKKELQPNTSASTIMYKNSMNDCTDGNVWQYCKTHFSL